MPEAKRDRTISPKDFGRLLELSSDVFWELDSNLRYTYLSRPLLAGHGEDASGTIGKTPWQAGKEIVTEGWLPIRSDLEAHQPLHGAIVTINSGAGQFTFMVKAEPKLNDDGSFAGYFGVSTDITPYVEARDAFTAAAQKLQGISGDEYYKALVNRLAALLDVEFAFVGKLESEKCESIITLALHADGQIADNFEYPLKGAPCQNVVGKTACCYAHNVARLFPDDALLEQMGIESYAGVPLFDHLNNPLGVLVVMGRSEIRRPNDVISCLQLFSSRTEAEIDRTRSERIMAKAKANLEAEMAERTQELVRQKSALDQHAIVSVTNVQGDIIYANDKFCDISGYSREELIGNNHRLLKSGGHSHEFYKDMWDTIAAGRTWHGQIKNLKKGGGYYWVDATIVPFLNDKGKPFQYVAIRTDITDRVNAQLEAEKAKTDAETANQAKSQFLSSMSHELRTPMNAIIGFSQLLKDSIYGELNDRQKDAARNIVSSGEHMLHLINQVLDLSKIEAGNEQVPLETVSLKKVVDESYAMTESLANRFDVNMAGVECCCDAGDIMVMANNDVLRQVIVNLISNAIKYNHKGGSVSVLCEQRQDVARISVRDTGIGIANENRDRIFQPFERLRRTRQDVEGSGIGLTITKSLAEMMSGRIGFESALGEGSTFWVEFPLADSA